MKMSLLVFYGTYLNNVRLLYLAGVVVLTRSHFVIISRYIQKAAKAKAPINDYTYDGENFTTVLTTNEAGVLTQGFTREKLISFNMVTNYDHDIRYSLLNHHSFL